MAILHSFVVIGIMVGYIFGAVTVTLLGRFLSWRFAFMIQGWFMIAIGVCFFFSDNKALDIFLNMKQEVRPKSNSDFHRDPSSSDDNHSQNNQARSNLDGRSSMNPEQKKSVRIDAISLQKNELQQFALQFKVSSSF